jgi:hypothetical protein
MANLSGIYEAVEKRTRLARKTVVRIERGAYGVCRCAPGQSGVKPRREISAQGRASIAAAQRARWAKVRDKAKVATKRTMSASSRRKIAAAQRRRWAKRLRDRFGAITKQSHDDYEYHPPNYPGDYCRCHWITINLKLAARQMLATTA